MAEVKVAMPDPLDRPLLVRRLPDIQGEKPVKTKFKSYPIGYFHIDIAEVRTERDRRSRDQRSCQSIASLG